MQEGLSAAPDVSRVPRVSPCTCQIERSCLKHPKKMLTLHQGKYQRHRRCCLENQLFSCSWVGHQPQHKWIIPLIDDQISAWCSATKMHEGFSSGGLETPHLVPFASWLWSQNNLCWKGLSRVQKGRSWGHWWMYWPGYAADCCNQFLTGRWVLLIQVYILNRE